MGCAVLCAGCGVLHLCTMVSAAYPSYPELLRVRKEASVCIIYVLLFWDVAVSAQDELTFFPF